MIKNSNTGKKKRNDYNTQTLSKRIFGYYFQFIGWSWTTAYLRMDIMIAQRMSSFLDYKPRRIIPWLEGCQSQKSRNIMQSRRSALFRQLIFKYIISIIRISWRWLTTFCRDWTLDVPEANAISLESSFLKIET